MEQFDLEVKIKKLAPDAKMPSLGSAAAAGFDLYANSFVDDWCKDMVLSGIYIDPHETAKISTGLAMAIPEGWEGQIRPRSGLATKKGLRPANTPGTIDADYRGPVIVALHNDSDKQQFVELGERIAQICFRQVPKTLLIEVNELDETERGEGGFGSTGTK